MQVPNNRDHEVLNRCITVNAHGNYNPQLITVPDGIEVLIPHSDGTQAKYTTPNIRGQTYEKSLYQRGYFNYNKGWKLYLPGDKINNIKWSPLGNAASCRTIDGTQRLQQSLIKSCRPFMDDATKHTSWCPLYTTVKNDVTGQYEILQAPNGKNKLKIKCCSHFDLEDLFRYLVLVLQNLGNKAANYREIRGNVSPNVNSRSGNIVIIPYTCNAIEGGQNEALAVDPGNTTPMGVIYRSLLHRRLQLQHAQVSPPPNLFSVGVRTGSVKHRRTKKAKKLKRGGYRDRDSSSDSDQSSASEWYLW